MKKTLLIVLASALAVACGTKPTYHVVGTIDGLDSLVYLQEISGTENAPILIDSTLISDGKFEFTGSVDIPKAMVLSDFNKRTIGMFFIENGAIKIEGSVKARMPLVVTGSESQILYDSLGTLVQGATTQDEFYGAIKDFVKANPKSVVSPFITLNTLVNVLSSSEIEEYIAEFDGSIMASTYVEGLRQKAENLKATEVGKNFIDFTTKDTEGNEVALSSLVGKGEWVLLDFWASWCSPCRAENPHVVAAFEEFKDKGFTIVGYSLDQNGEAWVEAIEKDGLNWANLSDLEGWASAPAKAYSVQSIPSNFLFNPEGKIAAKNLRGEALVEFLKENL